MDLETFRAYLEQIPAHHRAFILAGGIAFFWICEGLFPFRSFSYNKWRHAWPNFFFTGTTVIVNLLFAYLLVYTCDYWQQQGYGLLHLTELPVWLYWLGGLMLLDLVGAWLVHFIEHQVRWMWYFHRVHHTDTAVDTTTANRHHPIESIFRALFTLLAVVVSGAPVYLLMLYQSLSVVLSQFNHANIRLSVWLDAAIGWLLVTPHMHKVHHHYKQPYTDMNYGNIFSIWDRLAGTYAHLKNVETSLVYGLDDELSSAETERVIDLWRMPFNFFKRNT